MATLKIRGGRSVAHELTPSGALGLDGFKARPLGAVRIDAARDAGGETKAVEFDPANAVFAVTLADGMTVWTDADDFRREFVAKGAARDVASASGDAWEFAPQTEGGSSRGFIGQWIVSKIEAFGVDLPGAAAGLIFDKVDAKLAPKPGLSRIPLLAAGVPTDFAPLDLSNAKTDGPLLVFVHGTFSNLNGSFGKLWTAARPEHRKSLADRYGDRVFAFEHRTLRTSPVQNALDFVRALPQGARLHLVSHSRGGIVSELMCRGRRADAESAFTKQELDDVLKGRPAEERKLFETFAAEIKAKDVVVERFVRVACPARGTTLASERLDRWLSVLTSLMGRFGGAVLDWLGDAMAAIVKEKADPKTLPGVEAQMPDSPLMRLLNHPAAKLDADLSVIAGDAEGAGFFGRLKMMLPDLFFGGDHDLVVNTGSMTGGAERVRPARYFLDRGPDVNHFNYFGNEATARLVVDGLLRSDGDDAGFAPIAEAPAEAPAREVKQRAPRAAVFVLPGIMGSHLQADGDRIWLDPVDLALGGFDRIAIDAKKVRADAPIGAYYDDLRAFLDRTHDVLPFAYDWRRSITEGAAALAAAVEKELDVREASKAPVSFVAHSMGGLVVRAMAALHPDVWRRATARAGCRVVMLGTPNGGSFEIVRLLCGQSSAAKLLARLDFKHGPGELLATIAKFPGVLKLLPQGSAYGDWFARAAWEALPHAAEDEAPARPAGGDLGAARRALGDALAARLDPERFFYIAGRDVENPTPTGCSVVDEGLRRRVAFHGTYRGDGTVPWDTGAPPGLRTWYVDATHGDLPRYEPLFGALVEILETGATSRLAHEAPADARDGADPVPVPESPAPMFPSRDDLAAAALGGRLGAKFVRASRRAAKLRVTVTHGDLAYAKYPVLIGHYEADGIVGSEKALDVRLDDALTLAHDLGLHPGPMGTACVYLQADRARRPAGAVVAGLGKVGDLSARSLEAIAARGALELARAVANCPDDRFKTDDRKVSDASISAVLLGAGGGGLSVTAAVAAILRGVRRAAAKVDECRLGRRVRIAEIEFVERWFDRALEAAEAVRQARSDPALRDGIDFAQVVDDGQGGMHRLRSSSDDQWWPRVFIRRDRGEALRFTTMNDRAQAPSELVPEQRTLVDAFIKRASSGVRSDGESARALYELLLPDRLKSGGLGKGDLVLVVDKESARYPWELLQDAFADGARPPAVEAGLIRQLAEDATPRVEASIARDFACVIGAPKTDPTRYPPLPGAAKEAEAVAKRLNRGGFRVEEAIGADGATIVNKLFATPEPYRVLHIAAHGVHEYALRPNENLAATTRPDAASAAPGPAPQVVSGVVLSDDMFLTPAEVAQMRRPPELVFINCCHLGRTDSNAGAGAESRDGFRPHQLAANVAAGFISKGVRAVVAAGWAVDDEAASTFADKFYERLLAGDGFGDAVRAARRETYDRHPGVNTWGAYQCYGDPSYRLRRREHGTDEGARRDVFSAPDEVVVAMRNLAALGRTATTRAEIETLRKKLGAVRRDAAAVDERWLLRADLLAAEGEALGDFRRYAEAVEKLEAAACASEGTAPLSTFEQLGNLRVRGAVDALRRDEIGHVAAVARIKRAITELDALVKLGDNSERRSLLGGAWKRLAQVASDGERLDALVACGREYAVAMERDGGENLPARATTVRLTVAALLRLVAPGREIEVLGADQKTPAELCRRLRAKALAEARAHPRFFNAVTPGDVEVLEGLFDGDLAAHCDAAVKLYADALHRGASYKAASAVVEHWQFAAEVLADAAAAEVKAAAKKAPRAGAAPKGHRRAAPPAETHGAQPELEADARPETRALVAARLLADLVQRLKPLVDRTP